MRYLLIAALLFFLPVKGREFLIEGSESPNHRLVVYAVDARAEGAVGHLELREKTTQKVILDLGASGWVVTGEALADPLNTLVLWNSEGTYFAMKMRAAKREVATLLFKVDGLKASTVTMPDFSIAIHDHLKSDFGYRYTNCIPFKWRGNHRLIVVLCGDINPPNPGNTDFLMAAEVDVRKGKIISLKDVEGEQWPVH